MTKEGSSKASFVIPDNSDDMHPVTIFYLITSNEETVVRPHVESSTDSDNKAEFMCFLKKNNAPPKPGSGNHYITAIP